MVSKVSDTPSAKLVKPMQFGPSSRTPDARRLRHVLLGAAGRADFSEARREHDGAADPPPPACRNRLDHAMARHHEHHGIDAFRQLVYRAAAGTAVDLARAAADHMDVAPVAAALEIAQHRPADRVRLRGGADDRHRARPHQAIDRGRVCPLARYHRGVQRLRR
jgi:hypothetical protein